MGRCPNPPPSNPARMAATCPSIMPEGSNHVGPCLGVGKRRSRIKLQGSVVIYPSIVDDPAMTVAGVLAETHVRYYQQVRDGLLNDADGLLDDTVSVVGLGTQHILAGRQPEDDDAGDAKLSDFVHLVQQLVQ